MTQRDQTDLNVGDAVHYESQGSTWNATVTQITTDAEGPWYFVEAPYSSGHAGSWKRREQLRIGACAPNEFEKREAEIYEGRN